MVFTGFNKFPRKKKLIGLRYRIPYIYIYLETFMYILVLINYIPYKTYIFRFNTPTKIYFPYLVLIYASF